MQLIAAVFNLLKCTCIVFPVSKYLEIYFLRQCPHNTHSLHSICIAHFDSCNLWALLVVPWQHANPILLRRLESSELIEQFFLGGSQCINILFPRGVWQSADDECSASTNECQIKVNFGAHVKSRNIVWRQDARIGSDWGASVWNPTQIICQLTLTEGNGISRTPQKFVRSNRGIQNTFVSMIF